MEQFGNEIQEIQEQYTSKIELSFFRHGEKEKDDTKPDHEIPLTETGRMQATEKGETSGAKNINQAVIYYSGRERTGQTGGFVMAGQEESITGEETVKELEKKLEKINKEGPTACLSPAIKIDERLNFNFDGEFGEMAYKRLEERNYLKFLVEESDELAEKLGDKNASTYSKMASNIAGIIDKYLEIAPKWNNLVKDDNDNKFSDTLERFFCTHQGISESFLAKVIEKTKGVEERDRFVQVLDNYGFDFTEGFNVEILSRDLKKPIIHISYKKEESGEVVFEFDEKDVPLKTIKDMIKMSA